MKARVSREAIPECVLLYHLEEDDEQGAKVRRTLEELKIPIRTVPEKALGQKIGFLTGLSGFEPSEEAPPAAFEEPVMVMQGLSSVRMDRLFLALRKEGASVSLKAAVTPTNQHWSFAALCEEIKKEHAYMSKKHKTMHPSKE